MRLLLLLLPLLFVPLLLHSQRQGDTWVFGSPVGVRFVGDTFGLEVFQYTPAIAFWDSLAPGICAKAGETAASYSDSSGTLLAVFCARGENQSDLDYTSAVLDGNGNLIGDADSLGNDETYTQGGLFVEAGDTVFLLHLANRSLCNWDSVPAFYQNMNGAYCPSPKFMLATAFVKNGNTLEFVYKNRIILIGVFAERMIANRHGNGKDWWVIVPRLKSSCYKRFLVSETGIDTVFEDQCIGATTDSIYPVGQMNFSFTGTRLAVSNFSYPNAVQVFDFDRCNGLLSNPLYLPTPFYNYGVCFSPSGSYLYCSDELSTVYRHELSNPNPSDWDSVYEWVSPPGPPTAEFGHICLGPDKKMYVAAAYPVYSNCIVWSSFNSENLTVINQPDSEDCQIQPFSIPLLYGQSYLGLPNNPNYRLGTVSGGCATAIEKSEIEHSINIYPNPTTGAVTLAYSTLGSAMGTATLHDLLGREVARWPLPGGQGSVQVHLEGHPEGVYVLRVAHGAVLVHSERIVLVR